MNSKPSSKKAIEKRRQDLRGGKSVREISRDLFDQDKAQGTGFSIRNRKSIARFPGAKISRIKRKKPKDLGAVGVDSQDLSGGGR